MSCDACASGAGLTYLVVFGLYQSLSKNWVFYPALFCCILTAGRAKLQMIYSIFKAKESRQFFLFEINAYLAEKIAYGV